MPVKPCKQFKTYIDICLFAADAVNVPTGPSGDDVDDDDVPGIAKKYWNVVGRGRL